MQILPSVERCYRLRRRGLFPRDDSIDDQSSCRCRQPDTRCIDASISQSLMGAVTADSIGVAFNQHFIRLPLISCARRGKREKYHPCVTSVNSVLFCCMCPNEQSAARLPDIVISEGAPCNLYVRQNLNKPG